MADPYLVCEAIGARVPGGSKRLTESAAEKVVARLGFNSHEFVPMGLLQVPLQPLTVNQLGSTCHVVRFLRTHSGCSRKSGN